MKLTTCIRAFFTEYLPRVRGAGDRTIRGYKDTFKLFLPFAAKYYEKKADRVQLSDISTELILDFLDYLELERENSVKTRNLRLSALKSMARMIRLKYPEEKAAADRISYIPQKREQKPLFGFLTHEEMLKVFQSVDFKRREAVRDYTILHLMFDAGARASEIAGLNVDDFDPIEKNLGILGKGNRFRMVQLLPRTSQLIELYIDKHRPVPKPMYRDRLFINQRREGLTRHGIYRICRNHLEKVIPEKRLKHLNAAHCFRHSCAVHMRMNNHSLDEIKNHLGHEEISSTMIYLKLDLSRRKEVQKRFMDYMSQHIKKDPKLDDLIDWKNKKELLEWLDTL